MSTGVPAFVEQLTVHRRKVKLEMATKALLIPPMNRPIPATTSLMSATKVGTTIQTCGANGYRTVFSVARVLQTDVAGSYSRSSAGDGALFNGYLWR